MRFRWPFAFALLLTSFLAQAQQPAPAQTPPDDPLFDVATSQLGRALILRCLCVADTLQFDGKGHLETNKTHPEDWTLAGVNLQKVERKGAEGFQFSGVRVAIKWNDDNKEFVRHDLKTEPVKIVINGATTPEELRHAVAAIFSLGIDRALQTSLPPYWQHYFDPHTAWPEDGLKGVQVFTPGGTVAGVPIPAPALLNKPSAEYTLEAAHDKVSGPVLLHLVVDATGAQRRLFVLQPLGYGLDAKAVEAIEKAKFAPITVGGKQVASSLLVKQEFNIAMIQNGVVQ